MCRDSDKVTIVWSKSNCSLSSLLLSILYTERPGAELGSSGLVLEIRPYELPLSENMWWETIPALKILWEYSTKGNRQGITFFKGLSTLITWVVTYTLVAPGIETALQQVRIEPKLGSIHTVSLKVTMCYIPIDRIANHGNILGPRT